MYAFTPVGAKHEDKVRDVQRQVRRWGEEKPGKPMCTGRPGWKSITLQRITYKDRMYKIK